MPETKLSPIGSTGPYLPKAVAVLRALHHDVRQQIIGLLTDTEELAVTELFVALRMEQSAVSQHLKILRTSGIVKHERRGKFVYYRLDKQRLVYLLDLVKQMGS